MQSNKEQDNGVIDLEVYFAEKREVPKGKKYRIRIDKEHYVVDKSEMNGTEILALAGKTPDKFLLRQKLRGGVEPVEPNEVVSFVKPGVERFMTVPKEVTEGEGPQTRRDFTLLAQDVEFLDGLGLRWEAVKEGELNVIVIYDWPIPAGYNVDRASVHVQLTKGYPDAQIDMAYFSPALARADGKGISALSNAEFDGTTWQRWSRHRTAESKWRPGIDDLSTHLALVGDWLAAELRK
ncbi:MAG: multiubiquitin domain-containing protein [Burkholderiales bacterium]|nr:multiubiquitin domain-containing protein [Burkholderiales bacterium]